jgi:hypothetical protein
MHDHQPGSSSRRRLSTFEQELEEGRLYGSVLMVRWACHWRQFIASPIKKWGYVHEGRKAMMLLKYKVLDSTLLRRTKTERAADLALPPRTVRF